MRRGAGVAANAEAARMGGIGPCDDRRGKIGDAGWPEAGPDRIGKETGPHSAGDLAENSATLMEAMVAVVVVVSRS